MRLSKLWALLAPAALLLATPVHSFADQFSIQYLTTDNRTFLGLSSTGTAYFDYSFSGLSYAYSNGVLTSTSSAPPTFTADNGSACVPAGRCNGGFDAYSATFNGNPNSHLYSGTVPQDIWGSGIGPFSPVVQILAINSIGDIIFDDQANDNWYEAINLTTPPVALISRDAVSATTPEPASLLLLSTGLLASVFIIRRRRTTA